MALNPVERRLVDLCHHWEAFRQDPSKRLLIWQVPDNAGRMLQCFFEAQKHETDYSAGGLFIVFDAPFENSIQYSRDLKTTLAGRYDASRELLSRQGIASNWQYDPQHAQDSAVGVLQSLCSFADTHQNDVGHLVAVLMPSRLGHIDGFIGWVQRILSSNIPEHLRFVLIDSVDHPRFTMLTASNHAYVLVETVNIDALTTAQETFAQEGAVGPAAVFRNYLMGMVTLIEKGSADQVKAKAQDALAFARTQQWADQEVAVTMLLAGAFLKEKRFDEAIQAYRSARQAARQTIEAHHPAGKTLVMHTWFGEAGVQVAAGEWQAATDCYDQAAIVAQEVPNLILAIEAYRMGIFCQGRVGQKVPALERAETMVKLADQLKPDERTQSTLPFAGMDILRVVEPRRAKRVEDVKHRMDARQKQVVNKAEHQVARLSDQAEAQQFQAVERSLELGMREAEAIARQEFQAIVADSAELFQRYVSAMQRLLGPEWPLTGTVAITPLLEPEGTAVS
ncbi:MAG: hypothetical protein KF751_03340 [Nitrospira sp.]|nr:hypothetical protein [Nitrospira sp.]